MQKIFSVVKTLISKTSLDLRCHYNILYPDEILSHVKAVEQMLQIESYDQINETLKNEELQTAGEMFPYLIMCPDTIKPWIVFYKDLFQTQSPDKIILSLNRLMKGSRTQTNEFFKRSAEIFLYKILPEAQYTTLNGDAEAIKLQKFEGNSIQAFTSHVCHRVQVQIQHILKFLHLQIFLLSTTQFTS